MSRYRYSGGSTFPRWHISGVRAWGVPSSIFSARQGSYIVAFCFFRARLCSRLFFWIGYYSHIQTHKHTHTRTDTRHTHTPTAQAQVCFLLILI